MLHQMTQNERPMPKYRKVGLVKLFLSALELHQFSGAAQISRQYDNFSQLTSQNGLDSAQRPLLLSAATCCCDQSPVKMQDYLKLYCSATGSCESPVTGCFWDKKVCAKVHYPCSHRIFSCLTWLHFELFLFIRDMKDRYFSSAFHWLFTYLKLEFFWNCAVDHSCPSTVLCLCPYWITSQVFLTIFQTN